MRVEKGKSAKIEWLKPVFADDVLTGKATVTNLVKRNEKNVLTLLEGNGDFRSSECVEILKEADIVVTNPPFSCIMMNIKKNIDRTAILTDMRITAGECSVFGLLHPADRLGISVL